MELWMVARKKSTTSHKTTKGFYCLNYLNEDFVSWFLVGAFLLSLFHTCGFKHQFVSHPCKTTSLLTMGFKTFTLWELRQSTPEKSDRMRSCWGENGRQIVVSERSKLLWTCNQQILTFSPTCHTVYWVQMGNKHHRSSPGHHPGKAVKQLKIDKLLTAQWVI